MDGLVRLGIMVGVGMVSSLFDWATRARDLRRWTERWLPRAQAAGLREVEVDASLGSRTLRGRAGPHRVRLQEARTRDPWVQVVLEGESGLSLRPETHGTRLEKNTVGPRETQIGHQAFDDEVYVQGPEGEARAVLNAETRRALRALLQGRVRCAGSHAPDLEAGIAVRHGDLHARFSTHWIETLHRQLPEVMNALAAVADRLARPADIPGQIARNNAEEPEWQVRVANLRYLAEAWPYSEATDNALRRGAQDERLEVQLAAAVALPANEGRPLLLDIAAREWADDPSTATAIDHLGDGLPPDQALSILGRALRTRRVSTAAAALARLGRARHVRFVEPLSKVLALEKGPLAPAAARALGRVGDPSAEPALLEALDRDDPDLTLAALEALGGAGTVAAIPRLKDLHARRGVSQKVQAGARHAVALIQSRVVGASPGQLSLAEGQAGQLSLADEDPRGRLSLPNPSTKG